LTKILQKESDLSHILKYYKIYSILDYVTIAYPMEMPKT